MVALIKVVCRIINVLDQDRPVLLLTFSMVQSNHFHLCFICFGFRHLVGKGRVECLSVDFLLHPAWIFISENHYVSKEV